MLYSVAAMVLGDLTKHIIFYSAAVGKGGGVFFFCFLPFWGIFIFFVYFFSIFFCLLRIRCFLFSREGSEFIHFSWEGVGVELCSVRSMLLYVSKEL